MKTKKKNKKRKLENKNKSGRNWDVDSTVGNFHNEGRAGLEDSISADRIVIDNNPVCRDRKNNPVVITTRELKQGGAAPLTPAPAAGSPLRGALPLRGAHEDWFL